MKPLFIYTSLFCSLLFSASSLAMSVDELASRINSQQKITIIDIRLPALYQRSHIPNALNIPAAVIDKKRLPPLGDVVVYDEGVDDEATNTAVAALNDKRGIIAEKLEGGFTLWSTSQTAAYSDKGLQQKTDYHLSYQHLLQLTQSEQKIALVDLRTSTNSSSLEGLFSLQPIYSLTNNSTTEKETITAIVSGVMSQLGNKNESLLVLVGENNQLAERVAKQLYAAGVTRLRILTGGQIALDTKGQSEQAVRTYGGDQ